MASSRFFSRFSKLGLRGFGGIAGVAICSAFVAKSNDSLLGQQLSGTLTVTSLPVSEERIARKIITAADTSGLKLRLYQYQTCPFCSKVRAVLDYYGFSYEVVEVNPVTKKQIKFSSYGAVPILVAQGQDNQQLTDSSLIISVLRDYLIDTDQKLGDILDDYPAVEITGNQIVPPSFLDRLFGRGEKTKPTVEKVVQNKYFLMVKDEKLAQQQYEELSAERKYRIWADDDLLHMIAPNVYRTFGEALESFYWYSEVAHYEDVFSPWERYVAIYLGATIMYILGKQLAKKYHLYPDVRLSLYESTNKWLQALKNRGGRKFHGGDKPNLADLAVYGCLSSMEGCSAFKDLLANTEIGPWFYEMKKAVEGHLGAEDLRQALKQVDKKKGIAGQLPKKSSWWFW